VASVEDRRRQLEDRLDELNDAQERLEEDRDEVTDDELVGEVDEPDDDLTEELDDLRLGEMRAIRAAIDRIDAGTYGICTNCGQPIEEERLDSLPETPFCSACAQALDDAR
jgi:RNA polymerase-binding transcription factor DksA